MITREELSPPHTWCDSRCSRCPIGDCPVRLQLIRHDWGHQMRAEAQHEADVRVEEVLRDFRRAMNQIADVAESEKRRSETPEARSCFVSVDARQLSEVACRFFGAVHDVVRAFVASGGDGAAGRADEVLALISLVRIKAAQMTECRSDSKGGGGELDAMPNLLLLDATERQLRQPLRALRGGVPEKTWALAEGCRGDFARVLGEQLAGRVEAQRWLSKLIRQRRAPSPFCTV